ncbi:Poly polymerase, partial [Baffinella frigidus]
MLKKYLDNTHAKTHSTYSMELLDIFELDHEGADEKFKTFAADENRQLLWHGSRITNWAGILREGLLIAPPAAPVTGYMFGKGVYFADMSSKSANYCVPEANDEGILMLSEVALGAMHELGQANTKLPKGKPESKLSVKGVGATGPDPKGNLFLPSGCKVPAGVGMTNHLKKTSLLYNEYIIYNTAQ